MSEVTFKGRLKKDIYRTETYAVAIFESIEKDENGENKTYKCTGTLVPSFKNVTYEITAKKMQDTKYKGDRYEVVSAEISKDFDRDEMIDYLSSGMFPGIGRVTAERIYNYFGKDSVRIMEEEPRRLSVIKGMSPSKITKLIEEYKKNTSIAACFKYLSPFGTTLKQVGDIRKAAKFAEAEDIVTFVKEKPYSLMEVRGITFQMADMIAKDNGFTDDCHERMEAAAIHVIRDEMVKGHVACEYMSLATQMVKLLNTKLINNGNIKKIIKVLLATGRLDYKKIEDNGKVYFYIYLPYVRKAEIALATSISDNVNRKVEKIENIDAKIKEWELKLGVRLDESQKKAIEMSLTNGLSVITGGPGTGKTTIINIICDIWEKETGKEIRLMSPTGKAARRMAECTKRPAATIHSTMKFGLSDGTGNQESFTEDEIIEDALVIVDESSFIGLILAKNMFARLKNCQIVLVGDADQLPSVECGRVFADMIESTKVPTTKLLYTHRQSEGSLICKNAAKINQGDTSLIAGRDFQIRVFADEYGYDPDRLEKIEEQMVRVYKENISVYGKENVVLLCPFNKHSAGQLSVNKRIQEMVNPSLGREEYKGANDMVFRIGDPVMQLVNEDDISNGEVGTVISIDRVDNRDELLVKYEDQLITYDRDTVKNITLAYAMTVHKSQGSEYEMVITCLSDEHSVMLKRNILYTAITRAKKKVCIIGSKNAIDAAILNNTTEERHTMLWYDLKTMIRDNDDDESIEAKKEIEEPVAVQLSLFDEVAK